MPISIARLRRWFAAAAIFIAIVVLGAYFHARHRLQNALTQVPGKIGINIQQSARGFTISKSEQGRTIFKLQAGKAVQFKLGGQVELHNVMITVYGSDGSRFDQVYGEDFEYDQPSGNVTSKGEVSIDLQSNPTGMRGADQAPPKELKNPLHLKTTNLVFNQKTGDAWTASVVEFQVPQANGSAVGAKYDSKNGVLTLESQVTININGPTPSTILAAQAILQKAPRQIVLRQAHAESPDEQASADEVTLFLREDNSLDRAISTGNVRVQSTTNQVQSRANSVQAQGNGVRSQANRVGAGVHARGRKGPPAPVMAELSAQKLEVRMKPGNVIENAVLTGDVHLKTEGTSPAEAWAGRAVISFSDRNVITKIHAEEQVKLLQHASSGGQEKVIASNGRPARMTAKQRPPSGSQAPNIEVTAPGMDFLVADGQRLNSAESIGSPQISLIPSDVKNSMQTRATADKFTAMFDSSGELSKVHGEANVRVVSATLGTTEPERISTSDSIDALFRPGNGVEALLQQGHFTYSSGTQRAFADHARYTPAEQILMLGGSPRIIDTGMETTARSVRLNRATGDGFAEGDVKTTYSDLKPQPGGALLASSDPIHVTAQSMTAHNSPAIANYSGGARLWQNADVVEAPSIEFQKEQRTAIANSQDGKKVSTVLVGTDKAGKATPVAITSDRLIYVDSDRRARFQGGVTVRSSDLTITGNQMDVYLAPSTAQIVERRASRLSSPTGETPVAPQSQSEPAAKLEKIVASGSILITEPNRRATGDQLTYTASDDKFVLTGGPPSIFDAEHGKITGVSLTLFRRDDRVVVEGDSRSPAVTRTRVVR
jgi:lipopolysaccharide export system protein LptA